MIVKVNSTFISSIKRRRSACIFASSKNSVCQSNIFSELVQRAYKPAHQLTHSDITLIEKCQNRSRVSVSLPLASNSAHKGTHKIQLLVYSCNIQRAVEVKVLLKSKRESGEKREHDNRHLVHVIILNNTIKHLSEPKSYELALLYGKAKWRLFNTATTPCDSFAPIFIFDDAIPPKQIAVPFAVCTFGGFGEIAFSPRHEQARRYASTSKYFM